MTSIPASRRARAMIFAPRSCPSRPGFATTTRIFLLLLPSAMRAGSLTRLSPPPGEQARADQAEAEQGEQGGPAAGLGKRGAGLPRAGGARRARGSGRAAGGRARGTARRAPATRRHDAHGAMHVRVDAAHVGERARLV